MKNLVLLGESRRKLDKPAETDDDLASLCQVQPQNFDSESTTVILSKAGILTKVRSEGDVLWETNLEEVEEIGGGWFDVSFIDPELVCLSRLGAIVTVDPTTGAAELVGVFDEGLEAAAWSPDKEILLMVTSIVDDDEEEETKEDPEINAHLMTMNASFEVLSEVRIPNYIPSSLGESSKISVCWRPDGSLCAVSSVDAEDSMRNIRIYKRETLEVHAIGRAEDASGTLVKNLQTAQISWAGTRCSQLLASVQRKGKKTHQVVFFESNGLRHREFLLRDKSPTTVVTSLNWNASSNILAVTLREESGTDKIQLWHRCNYHWYLKRELLYPNQQVQLTRFSSENPHDLLVLLSGFEWRQYEVRWDPSTVLSFQDKSLAFVVDGSSLNLTAFQKALIPPPMCANSYGMENPINDIAFCKSQHHLGATLVQTSDGSLVFLQYKEGTASSFDPTKILWGETQGIDLCSLRSFLVVGAEEDKINVVAFQCASYNQTNDKLIEITISNISSREPRSEIIGSYELEGRLKRAVSWSDTTNGCLLQVDDGTLFEYEQSRETKIVPSEAEPLMEVCPWMSAIKDVTPYGDDSSDYTRPRLVFGLSSKSRLYLNDVMLAESASSFFLSLNHEFLCYATTGSRCQSRFLPLKEIHSFDPLMGLEQNYVLDGYEPRNVEQGSRVVAILPQRPQMILQMPRGNLESIYPRALVLRYLMTRIANGVYGEAFRMMRKHKVDLNLIVDLNPRGFLDGGIASFVKQVDVIDYLNLFISTLQNYDVTQARFPVPTWLRDKIKQSEESQTFDFSTKVNEICRKSRSVMLDFEKEGEKPGRYYLLPVLSTFAKENPPRLDEALSLIKDDALKENTTKMSKNPLFSENAQSSIKYLAFLAEYELLFETALGMYDFEIARAVARNSQMDPKVYLPLLKRYNTLPTYFARYEVDIRLKRYDMALKNLYESNSLNEDLECFPQYQISNGNSFEDCMKLINEQKLHKLGLELFRTDTDKSKAVLSALGNSLMEQRRPSTALTVYLSTEPPDMEGAMRAARSARDWRCYFSILESLESDAPTDQEEFRIEKRRQAAREIADDIIASSISSQTKKKGNMEASQLLLDYGDDLIGAVDCLTNAHCWSEAYRIATLHSRKDLMKKCVDSAIAFAHTSLGDFEDRVDEFGKTNTKYYEVLKLRKQNIYTQGPDAVEDDADETGSLFSAASTMSNMSLRSTSSTSSSSSIGSNVSSVISVKTANTFSMTGGKSGDRHRSKFNKGKKQKKRGKKRKPRRKPGSVEELQGLVGVLKSTCPDSDYGATITETIQFLLLVQNLELARELFNAYNNMRESIEKSRLERIEKTTTEKEKATEMTRSHGTEHDLNHILVDLPIDKVVDALSCAELDSNLSDFFDFLPN